MNPILPPTADPLTPRDLKEVFRLLAVDGHPRGEDDIDSWMLAARVGRWTRAQTGAATLTVVGTWTGFRIMPGHIAEQIAADRARIRQSWYCPDPPRSLRDDPAAEIAWRRHVYANFADRALCALAVGEPLEGVPMLEAPERAPVSALTADEQTRRVRELTERIGQQKALPAADTGRPGPVAPTRRVLDPEVRRQVRADLATRQPIAEPPDSPTAVGAPRDTATA